uniref:DB domain-containing protein n=1 Tax=Onchocerca volvulus TaxID=6282 RepID=A0A2K6W8P9_ONCVO
CHASGVCGRPYCPPVPPSYGCGQYGCHRFQARGSKNVNPLLLNNDQTWSQRLQTSFDRKPHESSVLLPTNNFRQVRDNQPLIPLDEQQTLAALSPTAAELPIKGRQLQDPNEAFLGCCMDRQLPDACLKKCNFNHYNQQTVTLMYLQQDRCPINAIQEMQFCAAQGRDHRPCCMRNGITTTLAGDKCLIFCDQRPGRVTQLDITFLPCFNRFEEMKACFWHDIIRYFR